jgi:hypothetical protein
MRPFSENGWADDAAFRAAVRRVEAVASRGIDMALDLAALYKESNAVVFQDPQELLAAHEVRPLSTFTIHAHSSLLSMPFQVSIIVDATDSLSTS